MRIVFTILLTFTSVFLLTGQDYFWIGGSGNWIDVSHWATTSGGSELHTEFPDSMNNVFFDENSFSEEKQEVKLNYSGLSCNNITISETSLKPVFKAIDYYDEFFIHGDFVSTSEMSWQPIFNHMVGNGESKISIKNEGFFGSLFISPRDSSAQFDLISDIIVNELKIENGHFDTKGFAIKVGEFSVGKNTSIGTPTVNLNDSNIETRTTIVKDFSNLDVGTSEIIVKDPPGSQSVLFFGGGHNFNKVIFEGSVDRIKDNNHFVEFTAMPGSNLSFEHGDLQSAEQFIFEGTSEAPIRIDSREEGSFAFLEQSEGEVNGNYLILKDNSAGGGAIFTASNSINDGNVEGWNIEAVTSEDYYWVGNSGSWSELEHWAKTSGGSSFHAELPNAIDNVFFDEKSVTDNSSEIQIDIEVVNVGNFSLAGLQPGSVLKTSVGIENQLNIYGNVALSEGIELSVDVVYFPGDTIQTISSFGTDWGFDSDLIFSSLSQIELMDDLQTHNISITKGLFNSNGHTVRVDKNFKMSTFGDPIINLSNSEIIVENWIPSDSKLKLTLDQSKVTCSGIFYGEGFTYADLILNDRNWVYGPVNANTLEFKPGSEILIFPGDTIQFNKLILNGTEQDSITIASREEGEQGYLYSEGEEVKGNYLIIRDNHAVGGASFIAENSNIDETNVEGWSSVVSKLSDIIKDENLFYPNPASDYIIAHFNDDVSLNFKIYDAFGKILHSHMDDGKYSEEVRISTDAWPSGLYYIVADDYSWNNTIVISAK